MHYVGCLRISDAAESIGFRTRGYRLTWEQLRDEVPLPCIVHWNQRHFVVVYEIKKKARGWGRGEGGEEQGARGEGQGTQGTSLRQGYGWQSRAHVSSEALAKEEGSGHRAKGKEYVNRLKYGEAVMSFPFDGRFYSCDKISSGLFKRVPNIEILMKRIPVMQLMHGYHSVGGAFIVNKEKYLEVGGENENFCGWGTEDTERVKRLEILGLPIYYSPGILFDLKHQFEENSWLANSGIKRRSRLELQKTCKKRILC
jgi:hypothetical protein